MQRKSGRQVLALFEFSYLFIYLINFFVTIYSKKFLFSFTMQKNQVLSPVWDIFSPQCEDSSITSWDYIELREKSAVSVSNTSLKRFQFEINDNDAFVLPSRAYLYAKLQVVDTAGSPGAAAGTHGLLNNAPLFQRIEWRVNGKLIEEVNYSQYVHLVRNLLEYSDDYSRSSGRDQGWFPDGGSVADQGRGVSAFTTTLDTLTLLEAAPNTLDTSALTTVDNTAYNSGFAKRSALAAGAAFITLRIPLSRMFGFAQLDKMTTGVRHEFTFIKHDSDADSILSTSATASNLLYTDLALFCPYIKPSAATNILVQKYLINDSAVTTHCFEYVTGHRYQVSGAQTRVAWDISSQVERVNKVIVFGVPSTANSDQTKNNMIFNKLDVTRANIRIGSFKYPQQDLLASDTDGDFIHLYNEFLRVADKTLEFDTGNIVDYETFKNVYRMFCFDLRNQTEGLFNKGKATDVRVELTGTIPDAMQLYAVVFSEREVVLSINNQKTLLSIA